MCNHIRKYFCQALISFSGVRGNWETSGWRASSYITRKSSCLNARGIPSATKQVLAILLCLVGEGGYPIQSWVGEVPHPVLAGGVPHPVLPHLVLARGYPFQFWLEAWAWDGVPPVQTWNGVPPNPDLGWGTPLSRPGMGYPPSVQTWNEVPHQGVDWHTKWK